MEGLKKMSNDPVRKRVELFQIVDDGTLDIVVACRICGGWIQRYSPDVADDEADLIEWINEDARETHECDARRLLSTLHFAHLVRHLDCEGVCPVRDALFHEYRDAKAREEPTYE